MFIHAFILDKNVVFVVTANRLFKISIDLFLTKSGFSFKITV